MTRKRIRNRTRNRTWNRTRTIGQGKGLRIELGRELGIER